MMRTLFALALVLPLMSPVAAMAGTPTLDVAGIWDLHTETPVPGSQGEGEVPPICEFDGTAQVSQDGTALSGSAALALTDGPVDCPMELSATLTGQVAGDQVEMGVLMGGNLGTAFFSTSGSNAQEGTDGLAGVVSVETGPFAGIDGFWSAVRRDTALAIPTLGPLGLALMVGLLVVAATFLLRRRQTAV